MKTQAKTKRKTQKKQQAAKRRSAIVHKPVPSAKRALRDAASSRASAQTDAIKNRKPVRQESPKNVPNHVLIRVRAEAGLTIEAHQRMVARHGVAMFGKFGQRLGPEFRDFLNHQAGSGQKTYLFVTTRDGWGRDYITYRCPLRRVLDTLSESARHLVPSYYVGDAAHIGTWFEIEGIECLSGEEMSRIFVLSSGRSITNAIFSKTGVFRVGVHNASRR